MNQGERIKELEREVDELKLQLGLKKEEHKMLTSVSNDVAAKLF